MLSFSTRLFCKVIGFGIVMKQRAGGNKRTDTFILSVLSLKQEVSHYDVIQKEEERRMAVSCEGSNI